MRPSASACIFGLVAFLVAGFVAPFCAPVAASASMPCCRTGTRCDFGMKTAACCRLDPVSAASGAVALQAPASKPHSKHGPVPGSAPEPNLSGTAPSSQLAMLRRMSTPAFHGSAPPIYLLNATILR